MNKRALVIALLSSLVGVALLQLYMRRFEEKVSGGEPLPILLMRKDTPAGTILTAQHVAAYDVPERFVSARHVRGSDLKSVIGTRVTTSVKVNEPLLWTDIAQGRQDRSLADRVQEGMVAVRVQASTFDGLLGPGDRVDVVFVVERGELISDIGAPVKAVTLLQSVLVMSVQGKMVRDPQGSAAGGGSVILQLTPEQARLVLVSQRHGKIDLVLRNSEDLELRSDNTPVVSEDLVNPKRRTQFMHARRSAESEGADHAN